MGGGIETGQTGGDVSYSGVYSRHSLKGCHLGGAQTVGLQGCALPLGYSIPNRSVFDGPKTADRAGQTGVMCDERSWTWAHELSLVNLKRR